MNPLRDNNRKEFDLLTKTQLLDQDFLEKNAGYIPKIDHLDMNSFFQSLYSARNGQILDSKSKTLIQNTLLLLDKKFADDIQFQNWISSSSDQLITWNGYSKAWYSLKKLDRNPSQENDITQSAYLEICFAYYYWNALYVYEKSFDAFMEHEPQDYTRPHNWYKEPDYVGFGEALAALISLEEDKTGPNGEVKMLENFAKRYPEWFSNEPSSLEDLLIPYEVYSKCFEEATSIKKIKPHSIEICVYYILQNGLDMKYVIGEKAPKNHPERSQSHYYFCTSFKFFDVFTFCKYLSIWELWLNVCTTMYSMNKWKLIDFERHCKLFRFRQWPIKKSPVNHPVHLFYWKGIEPIHNNFTFQDGLMETLSFFGDHLNAISFALLIQSQLLNSAEKLSKVSETQKGLFLIILGKFQDIVNWLNLQDIKEPSRQAVWLHDYAKIFYLTFALPLQEEVSNLLKSYGQQPWAAKPALVFRDVIEKNKLYLSKSDLVCLDPKNYDRFPNPESQEGVQKSDPLDHALWGMKAIETKINSSKAEYYLGPLYSPKSKATDYEKSPKNPDSTYHSLIKAQDLHLQPQKYEFNY